MGRRLTAPEEGKLYWELIEQGKTHIEAWQITESAFNLNKYKKPNYELPKLQTTGGINYGNKVCGWNKRKTTMFVYSI